MCEPNSGRKSEAANANPKLRILDFKDKDFVSLAHRKDILYEDVNWSENGIRWGWAILT